MVTIASVVQCVLVFEVVVVEIDVVVRNGNEGGHGGDVLGVCVVVVRKCQGCCRQSEKQNDKLHGEVCESKRFIF